MKLPLIRGIVLVALLALTGSVSGHGGQSLESELMKRTKYAENNTMTINHCHHGIKKNHGFPRTVMAEIQSLRKRQLEARDVDGVLGTNHEKDEKVPVNPSSLFGKIKECVLHEEATIGPFYVSNELDREEINDGQTGIPFVPMFQVVDKNNCQPVKDIWFEIWHANSTGIYSGIVSDANGSGQRDPGNADTNFHRGVQKTNGEGIVHFYSKFPGSYPGRTPHLHVNVHRPSSRKDGQGRVIGDHSIFRGQIFVDQGLIDAISAEEPYKGTRDTLEAKGQFQTNADDAFFRAVAEESDPVMNYAWINADDRKAGIVAWIRLGVDMGHDERLNPAAEYGGN